MMEFTLAFIGTVVVVVVIGFLVAYARNQTR